MNLTSSEYKIAELTTRGYSEKEIAEELFVSRHTVRNHAANIRKKIGARSAVDVAREFILSLDNPRKFFVAIGFLLIQAHVMINCSDIDLRRPTRSRTTQSLRITRKHN